MVRACEEAGVQFMDGTMWVHNPRAALMKDALSKLGPVKTVTSIFSFFGRALTPCPSAPSHPLSTRATLSCHASACWPLGSQFPPLSCMEP